MYTLYHNYDNVQEKLVWCYNTTIWLGNKGIESIEGAVLNNENPQRYLKADHELFSRKLNILQKKIRRKENGTSNFSDMRVG